VGYVKDRVSCMDDKSDESTDDDDSTSALSRNCIYGLSALV